MANNPYKNKVIYNGTTLIDLTGDNVTAADVKTGTTFHLPTGETSTGTGPDVSVTTATASDVVSGKVFISDTGSVTVGTGEFDMFIAKYGSSTYAEVLAAYQKNMIVYCRASSSSNPASGNQLRMAFLAYVNNEATPTEFEFQYYRSVATHSDSQQGDQVYIYKLKSASGWESSVREE